MDSYDQFKAVNQVKRLLSNFKIAQHSYILHIKEQQTLMTCIVHRTNLK